MKGLPLLGKALFLLSGNATAAALTLARNLVLARMLPVEDYGIAATFAVTMAVVEMASALGLQQQIVQSKDGDDPRFQAALQGFQVLRGLVSGLVLFLIAHPVAGFLGIPHVAWAYQVLAVMPVLHALVHFDIHRMQRRMRYGPGLLSVTLPAFVSLLLVWPLVAWLGDWRAMLAAMLAQGVAMAVLSHLVAERRYALVFDRRIIAGSLRFGWPLLVNAVLLFLVFNGEKLIIGRELGMAALGIFAMGITLTLTPTLVVAKSVMGLFLPQLSDGTASAERRKHVGLVAIETVLCLAAVFVAVVALIGGPVVQLLLGPKYAELISLMTWLALLQGIRMFKAGPAIVALAIGQTGNALASNIVRVAALPLAWYVATTSGNLLHIVWIAIASELAGHAVALALLRIRQIVPLRQLVLPHLAALGLCGAAAAYALILPAGPTLRSPDLWAGTIFAGLIGMMFWAMPDLRLYLARRGGSEP